MTKYDFVLISSGHHNHNEQRRSVAAGDTGVSCGEFIQKSLCWRGKEKATSRRQPATAATALVEPKFLQVSAVLPTIFRHGVFHLHSY